MLLFSEQGHDLRTFSERICLKKGTHQDRQSIQTAKQTLYQKIGTDQVIWCSQQEPAYTAGNVGRFLHKINVSAQDVVAVVDCLCWHQIAYEDPTWISPRLWREYYNEASRRNSDDSGADFERIRDEHLRTIFPGENYPCDRWDHVCKTGVEEPEDSLLIKWPFSDLTQIVKVWRLRSKAPHELMYCASA